MGLPWNTNQHLYARKVITHYTRSSADSDGAFFNPTDTMKKLFLFASAILTLSACSQKEAAQTTAPAAETDSTYTVSGQLVIAHEVRAFTADGDTTEQWIIDKSGKLISDYRSLTGDGVEKATPVKAVLKVKNLGKLDDGFAADYDNALEVVEIVSLQPLE